MPGRNRRNYQRLVRSLPRRVQRVDAADRRLGGEVGQKKGGGLSFIPETGRSKPAWCNAQRLLAALAPAQTLVAAHLLALDRLLPDLAAVAHLPLAAVAHHLASHAIAP